jgi:hypothetical protein
LGAVRDRFPRSTIEGANAIDLSPSISCKTLHFNIRPYLDGQAVRNGPLDQIGSTAAGIIDTDVSGAGRALQATSKVNG